MNDPVYAETSFPVVSNSHMVIPAGTYVQGVIRRLRRPGRIKGRGELVIGFNALIFASGYTLPIPGSIDSVPGTEKDGGERFRNHCSRRGVGAALGGLAARSVGGADVGGLVGAGIGLVSILRSRGPDARIESGTLVEMVLERPILVECDRIAKTSTRSELLKWNRPSYVVFEVDRCLLCVDGVDAACHLEILLGESAGVVGGESESDAVVNDADIRVMAFLFGDFGDLVHENHGIDEIFECQEALDLIPLAGSNE